MPSITYLMVRSAKGASRTTHGVRAAPGFRFETNSFTRPQAGIEGGKLVRWASLDPRFRGGDDLTNWGPS